MNSISQRSAHPWVLTSASLVVKKSDLDPDAVSARLGLRPTAVRLPGADRWGPPGEVDGRWRLTCDERTTRDPTGQLEHLLSEAEGCASQLRMMQTEGFEVHLEIHGFAEHGSQFLVPAPLFSRISRLGVPLTLTPNLNAR
ncbi:DUF4279 domain-containing protein [Streptomyces sp. MT206]|uniref:DUF4279 domain-containing protein n=1 Tax=Streptomyces sp. MT206 TaxID=3031407 RepID=UPI003FA6C146